MSQVLHILFGAVFTVAVAMAMGTLLLGRLRVTLHRGEAALMAFLAGSACLSLTVFLLCAIHQARRGVFTCLGLAVIAWAAWDAGKRPPRKGLPAAPRAWMALFLVIFSAFFVVYFFNALAPEISPDGSGYHLGNVARYWRHHGFAWDYHSMYSYLSQGIEMLFLVAFGFGQYSAAAMVHFAFLTALPLLMVCYGRRFGFPRAGLFSAILVYASPVVGIDGVSAYNDVAVATVIFAAFYLLQVWDETRERNLLILVGLLAGFAYGLKYTAFLAVPFAAAFAWWRTPAGAKRLPQVVTVTLAALVMITPWLLRNWIWVGNPFAPFLNSWFPNPYYSPAMEREYIEGLRHYTGIQHFWDVPLELAVRGGSVAGTTSPVFLLFPLSLLALRHPHARRLLLAALVFSAPAWFNTGTRFLIPGLPFLALAMGLGLARPWGVLPALAVFHAVTSWPSVLSTYCGQWSWRIAEVPVRAALRIEPEAAFLERHIGEYALRWRIDRAVPPNGKIFSFAGRPAAYLDRDIVVFYESSLGKLAQDALWTPLAHKPQQRQRFRFPPVTARAVRVVEAAAAEPSWTVAEMRVFSEGRELARSPDWRLSAWPNGWQVQLAFDNNYATRWTTAQPMTPKAHIAIDFGRAQRLDEVMLECASAREAQLEVEISTAGARWTPLASKLEQSDVDPPGGIRLAATRELSARGIGYLLIDDSDYVAEDMRKYSRFWGITEVAAVNGTRFYRID